jgi:hypothetical protein
MEELDKLICAVDETIEVLSISVPSADAIIALFVSIVAGFEAIEKQARQLAEENQIPEEDVKEIIKKQKDAYIEQMKTAGKAFIDAKRAELIAMLSQLKAEAIEIPKSIAKSIADAAMPTMIAPGAPNPASSALRLYLSLVKIKASILLVLVLASKILHLIKELGLGGSSGVAIIKGFVDKILALKKEIEAKLDAADAAECEGAKPEDYKVKDPDGVEINGPQIQTKTFEFIGVGSWPLSKTAKRAVKKKIKNAEDDSDDATWGDIIMGYSGFYEKAISK